MDLRRLLAECEQYSDSEAVFQSETAETRLSFPKLVAGVRKLVRELRNTGLTSAALVGIQGKNGYDWLLLDLALIEIGATLMAFPENEQLDLGAVVEKYDLAFFATDRRDAGDPRKWVVELSRLSAPDWPSSNDLELRIPSATGPQEKAPDLLTQTFSSGTSGYLKGLNISRKGTELLVQEFVEAFHLGPNDRMAIFLPFSNYQQRMLAYACLYHGISVLCTPFIRVLRELRQFRPTVLIAPPAFYDQIIRLHFRGDHPSAALRDSFGGNIRVLITGMAPVPRRLLETYEHCGIHILEVYGVVETGMISWNTIDRHRVGTMGKSLDSTTIMLSDDGEIIVGKLAPLSLGYFECRPGDQEKTYLSPTKIATGDLGSFDQDGYLEFKGRVKDVLVTSAGVKFSPTEVEERFAGICGITSTTVVHLNENDALVLGVFLVDNLRTAQRSGIEAKIDKVNKTIESFKRLNRIVVTDLIFTAENGLLTRNMKKDRRAIAKYFQNTAESGRIFHQETLADTSIR